MRYLLKQGQCRKSRERKYFCNCEAWECCALHIYPNRKRTFRSHYILPFRFTDLMTVQTNSWKVSIHLQVFWLGELVCKTFKNIRFRVERKKKIKKRKKSNREKWEPNLKKMKKLNTLYYCHSKIQCILDETFEIQLHSPIFHVIPLFFNKVPCQVPSSRVIVGDIAKH